MSLTFKDYMKSMIKNIAITVCALSMFAGATSLMAYEIQKDLVHTSNR